MFLLPDETAGARRKWETVSATSTSLGDCAEVVATETLLDEDKVLSGASNQLLSAMMIRPLELR